MSQLYSRVFVKILESSIAEDFTLRHVFEDFLKVSENGIVDATRQSLARRFNIPIDRLNECINRLESPDPASRDEEFEGRRIERLDSHRDWGWKILNWHKWEAIKTKADMAIRQSNYREQKRESVAKSDPTLEEVKLAFTKGGGTEAEAEKFFNHYQSNGWKVGRLPMKSMPHAVAGWITRAKEGAYGNASGGTWESTKRLEAIQARIKEIMDRGTEDAMGWRAASDKDRSELSRLKKKKKEIEEGLTK